MAAENRDWGYLRIQGALWNLGHEQRPRNGTPPRFLVSIHAPRAGGDTCRTRRLSRGHCFNPRPPRGGRLDPVSIAVGSDDPAVAITPSSRFSSPI
jgi:hypothetical protein